MPQVHGGVPARVVSAATGRPYFLGPIAESANLAEGFGHLLFRADDAHLVLHHVLEFFLNLIGSLAAVASQGRQGVLDRGFDLTGIDLARRPVIRREAHGVLAGAFAKDHQIRERIPAQAIGAVQPSGAFPGGEQSGHVRHLRVGVDADAAHDVVGRRADFHRFLGDVQIGQLLELVVHARELLLDVLPGVRDMLLDPGDIEKDAAMRAAAAFLDFPHDAAGDMISGQ